MTAVAAAHVLILLGCIFIPGLKDLLFRDTSKVTAAEFMVAIPPEYFQQQSSSGGSASRSVADAIRDARRTAKRKIDRRNELERLKDEAEAKKRADELKKREEQKEKDDAEQARKNQKNEKIVPIPGLKLPPNPVKPSPNQHYMTPEEIARYLKAGAMVGDHNAIPDTEMGLYVAQIANQIRSVWTPPSYADSRGAKPVIKIRLGAGGMVLGYDWVAKSGNASVDNSVIDAMTRVKKIDGLQDDFIRKYPELTLPFEVLPD